MPYNPEQNVMADIMSRTLVEMICCMLNDARMGKVYWYEAVTTAADIHNQLPSASIPKASPLELMFRRKPRIEILRVFGSLYYAHIAKTKRSKLTESGVRCRLLGYAKDHKSYQRLNRITEAIAILRSVTFAENRTMKPLSDSTLCVIDVLGEDDSDTKMEDTSTGVSTPRSGSPRSERFNPDPT